MEEHRHDWRLAQVRTFSEPRTAKMAGAANTDSFGDIHSTGVPAASTLKIRIPFGALPLLSVALHRLMFPPSGDLVQPEGLEPSTVSLGPRCASNCAMTALKLACPEGIRTPDLQLRRLLLFH